MGDATFDNLTVKDLSVGGGLHADAAIQVRIIKGTYYSTKRSEVGSDQLRAGLHFAKDSGKSGEQRVLAVEKPIVRPVLASVLP